MGVRSIDLVVIATVRAVVITIVLLAPAPDMEPLAFLSNAQAQELRAAPPREPDVLRAAPDPGTVAQEYRDIAGRWLGAGDAAVQSFGKAGGTLTNIVTGKFDGLTGAISKADWAGTLGAASALDVRGTVSGAAAIAVGGNVTTGGAALFGEIGTVAGGAVGSFFPVIGNIAGSIVGGAVGTAAGGFICAFGYDKYVKDYVAKGVTGIVSVFDTAPLTKAMEAKRAFLWATMAPEERAQLQGFNPEEVTLLDFGTLPYVLVPKQPLPDAQQQAALPPGGPSTVTGNIQIHPDSDMPFNCTIAGGAMRCESSYALGSERWRYQFEGTISGSTATGYQSTVHEQRYQSGCGYRDLMRFPARYDFEDGGRVRITLSPAPVTVLSNTCPEPPPIAKTSPGASGVDTWRARQ